MSVIPFIAAIICMAVLIVWFVQDQATRGGTGRSGLLGMDDRAGFSGKAAKRSGTRKPSQRPWRVHRR